MKQLTLLLVSVLYVIGGYAQQANVPTEEDVAKGKEINSIKRSEEAVYADVMEFVAPESDGVPTLAQQRSQQMLQAHVIEIFAKRMKMDKKDVQEIWDVIDDKCQNIVVRRGDLCRVFTYIMKDALGLTPKKPKKGDVEKYLTPDQPQTVTAETNQQGIQEMTEILANIMTSGQDSINNVTTAQVTVSQSAQVHNQVQAQVQEQADQSKQQSTVPVQQTAVATQVTAPVQQVSSHQTAATTTETKVATAPTPTKAAEPNIVEVPQLAKTMLAQTNMTELLRFLLKEKNRQTLMYGSLSSMSNLENCYVVIINKAAKRVVTVLGPGNDQRINYVTSKYDSIANYKGGNYQAIVVQEY